MKTETDISLCLTIGKRPELLRQTLESLFAFHEFSHVLAINDFRDQETNQVFKDLCPHGQLFSLDRQLGHHAAVDHMYAHVQTPWIFHCEDDWAFDTRMNLEAAKRLLDSSADVTSVCFRRVSDVISGIDQSPFEVQAVLPYVRLDSLHEQWHGYTFNPHLAHVSLWHEMDGFAGFKKERHISRSLRGAGRFVAYDAQGSCYHIGEDSSVSLRPPWWKRLVSGGLFAPRLR